jgi:hypothetical protein
VPQPFSVASCFKTKTRESDVSLTLAECKARARGKLELAEREPRHRRKHTAAAQAWLRLAATFDQSVLKPANDRQPARAPGGRILRAAL